MWEIFLHASPEISIQIVYKVHKFELTTKEGAPVLHEANIPCLLSLCQQYIPHRFCEPKLDESVWIQSHNVHVPNFLCNSMASNQNNNGAAELAMLDSWNLPCILLSISLAKTLGGIEEMCEINCLRERNKEIFWSSPTNRTTIWWFSGGKP
jgi:hypothetical protein